MEQKELDTLFRCAVGLYGILHVRHLKEVIEHYSGEHCTRKEILHYLETAAIPGCCFKDGFLYQEGIFDSWQQWETILERSANKPLYFPKKDEFLHYADANYIEWNVSSQALLDFLAQQTSYGNLRPLVEKIALQLRRGSSPQEEMRHLLNANIRISEEQLGRFGNLFVQFYNHIRLYVDHGYTPEELKDAHFKKQRT